MPHVVRKLLIAGFAVAALGSARAAEVVYSNAFDPPTPTPEWTITGANTFGFEQDRATGSWFLGRFFGDIFNLYSGGSVDNRMDATLSLAALPPHRSVTIAFDLYVIGSWDGNSTYPDWGGPDRFQLGVVGGPTLVNTTFSNCSPATQTQAWPDDVPAEHPSTTGALAVDVLGVDAYVCPGGYHDAVYHIVRTFDHVGPEVALRFSGIGLQWWFDEAWGLDNVTVSVDGAISWSGFLAPIRVDGSSVFKAGSTVSVKFFLADASAGITDLAARFSYAKIVGPDLLGPINEAVSTSAANDGNTFRYDAAAGQYVFNWGTGGIEPGLYRLFVDLGDGATHAIDVGLR